MPASKDKVKADGPNPVDTHVGQRIRDRRKALGMSQEKLAGQLGLTFQQVQKYERGANRVSASKLYEIARSLNASISFFFDHLPDTAAAATTGVAEGGDVKFDYDMTLSPEGRDLAQAFARIRRAKIRRQLSALVKALADEEAGEA